jgi:hypothetical protein
VFAHGRWFSPGTPASSITKTGRHDIAEILMKVVLNNKNHINLSIYTQLSPLNLLIFMCAFFERVFVLMLLKRIENT